MLWILFYQPNYGMAFIEAIIAILVLFFIVNYVFNLFFKENEIIKSKFRRVLSLSCLIIFGIIFGVRALFEILGIWAGLFRYLNNDPLFFAIMITIFLFLHKPLLERFELSRILDEKIAKYNNFKKIIIIILGVMCVVAGIFLSISILPIRMGITTNFGYNSPIDIYFLGMVWAFWVLFFNVMLTTTINKTLPIDRRIPKKVLKYSMLVGGLVSFSIWSIQLTVFELYFNRWGGIELIVQDIRVLAIVVSIIYIVFFFNSLKVKYLPQITEKSSKRVQELLQQELNTSISDSNNKTEDILKAQDLIPTLQLTDNILNAPICVSYRNYVFLNRRFGKSDEKIIAKNIFKGKIKIIVVALWVITIGIFISTIFLTLWTSSLPFKIFLLSYSSAFFILLIDFSITLIYHRITPINKRVSKNRLRNALLLGGIIFFWIWMGLFLFIYSFLFIWISETIILNLSFITILSVVMFALGIRIVKWYAAMKNWDFLQKKNSGKKAFRVSLIWLIIDIPFGFFFLSIFGDVLLLYLFITIINITIGVVVIFKVYGKNFTKSLKFTIVTQLILLGFTSIIGIILSFFQSLFSIYQFSLIDMRIPLIISTTIYVFSFLGSLRIKLVPEVSEKVKEELKTILQPEAEVQIQVSPTKVNNRILEVKDLTTYFYTDEGIVRAVEGVSFEILEGEVLGLVGETGCGKSVTALSILRLVRPPGKIKSGEVLFRGEDLHSINEEEILNYRGNRITMIFQDPLNSLNPVFRIGDQISEVYLLHMEDKLLVEAAKHPGKSIYSIAREWSENLLKDLNIPFPKIIFDRYPHELSGGMRQRVQIAMGLACSPKLLIADEPTTALDVTIQNQILKLMKELKKKHNTSILFITHDLGIISKMCDRVAVMYSGFIVEYGDIEKLFITPYHPYTRGLISSVPIVGKKKEELDVIPGTVPNLIYPPSGCRFHPRCEYRFEPCDSIRPKRMEIEPKYYVACHLYDPSYKDLAEVSIQKAEKIVLQ